MRAGYHIEVPRQITMKRKSDDQCAYDGQCVLCVVGDRRPAEKNGNRRIRITR